MVSSVLLWCARVRVWCVVASAVMLSGVGCVLKRQHMGFNEDVVLAVRFLPRSVRWGTSVGCVYKWHVGDRAQRFRKTVKKQCVP